MPNWPTSQLNSDDLRNVGQALVMQNSFDILPASFVKHLRRNLLGLDVSFENVSPELKYRREDVRSADKNLVQGV